MLQHSAEGCICTYTQYRMIRNQGRGLSWSSLLFSLLLEEEIEGRGLDPFMYQPSAKKEMPAKMAALHAWEDHLLYCLMATFHCSLRVARSGLVGSGGFRYLECFHFPLDSGGFGYWVCFQFPFLLLPLFWVVVESALGALGTPAIFTSTIALYCHHDICI